MDKEKKIDKERADFKKGVKTFVWGLGAVLVLAKIKSYSGIGNLGTDTALQLVWNNIVNYSPAIILAGGAVAAYHGRKAYMKKKHSSRLKSDIAGLDYDTPSPKLASVLEKQISLSREFVTDIKKNEDNFEKTVLPDFILHGDTSGNYKKQQIETGIELIKLHENQLILLGKLQTVKGNEADALGITAEQTAGKAALLSQIKSNSTGSRSYLSYIEKQISPVMQEVDKEYEKQNAAKENLKDVITAFAVCRDELIKRKTELKEYLENPAVSGEKIFDDNLRKAIGSAMTLDSSIGKPVENIYTDYFIKAEQRKIRNEFVSEINGITGKETLHKEFAELPEAQKTQAAVPISKDIDNIFDSVSSLFAKEAEPITNNSAPAAPNNASVIPKPEKPSSP